MIDRAAIVLDSVYISPAPPDPNLPPPTPDQKPSVTIDLKFKFPPELSPAQAALATRDFYERLKSRFTGRSVSITSIAGNLAVDKLIQGSTKKTAEGEAKGPTGLESAILITGALE
jgi:hypothetical protein